MAARLPPLLKSSYGSSRSFLVVLVVLIIIVGVINRESVTLPSALRRSQQVINTTSRQHHQCQTTEEEECVEKKKKEKASSSSAQQIVQKAYERTFAHLMKACPSDETMMSCLKNTQQQQPQQGNNISWPWWFQTMMRDGSKAGIHGQWHDLRVSSENDLKLSMCVIEKIGTKHWREVQCRIMKPNAQNYTRTSAYAGPPCQPQAEQWGDNHNTNTPKVISRSVFLRDPLERFLSGFLDKCMKRIKTEPHCEPVEVFRSGGTGKLLQGIVDNKQRYFEAYVDTMPLKWNIHFFPQSLYCNGLSRNIHQYDFVGHMGPTFYRDVQRMGDLFNNTVLKDALEATFDLQKKLRNPPEAYSGVEMSASSHVLEYYTPRTVRRVLQFMSIDYIMLDLPIPTWAQEMLDKDEQQQEADSSGADMGR